MRRRRYEDEFEGGVDGVLAVDCPAAACIVLWRALCEPRPMDPALPLMFNDGELYRRLRQKGYRCDIVPDGGARHLYGASIRRVPRGRMRAEYVAALRRYSAPWPPLTRWGLWSGLAADGAIGLLRTMVRPDGASSAARGRARGTLGGLGLPGGVAPWLTPKPSPKAGLRGSARRARQAPRRIVRSSTLRARRRWFSFRLRLAAALVGSRMTIELHPTADIGWRQHLEIRPRSRVVVRVGERSTIRDDVILRLGGTLDVGPFSDILWGCILNVKGTLRMEARCALGRGTSCHADGTMVWEWGSMCGEYVSVVDTNHDVDGSLLHPLDQAVPQADITIGATAFLGAHSVVTAGCTIGRGTVVGANSVVTRDLPAGVLAAGVPAKVIKELPGPR
jgi:acetyltransferase-like isoleucine patch superfamily enzyme